MSIGFPKQIIVLQSTILLDKRGKLVGFQMAVGIALGIGIAYKGHGGHGFMKFPQVLVKGALGQATIAKKILA